MTSEEAQAWKYARIENMIIMVCTTALVLGLYYMGAGNHSFWGLCLLVFVNVYTGKKKPKEDDWA